MDNELTKYELKFIESIAWELCNDHSKEYIERITKSLNLDPFELMYQLNNRLNEIYKV